MGYRNAPQLEVGHKGLGVLNVGGSAGGVQHVAHRNLTCHLLQLLGGEHVCHQAHGLVGFNPLSIGDGDSRTLLPTMLEGIQAVVGQLCGIELVVPVLLVQIDSQDAALFLQLVLVRVQKCILLFERQCSISH